MGSQAIDVYAVVIDGPGGQFVDSLHQTIEGATRAAQSAAEVAGFKQDGNLLRWIVSPKRVNYIEVKQYEVMP